MHVFAVLATLFVLCLIAAVAIAIIEWMPFPADSPMPFKAILKVIVGLFVLIYLIAMLFGAAPLVPIKV